MANNEDSALNELESLASQVLREKENIVAGQHSTYPEESFSGVEEVAFPGFDEVAFPVEPFPNDEEDEEEDDEDYEAALAYKKLYQQQTVAPGINDDDLIKQQQSVYGTVEQSESQPKPKKRKKKQKSEENTDTGVPHVNENPSDLYVEGLPLDITAVEFVEYFSKTGIIRKDLQTGTTKVKLYKTPEGLLKGDGLVCYFKKESVDLALSILDGAEIRPNYPLKLSKAKFVLKPNAPKKRKRSKKVKTIDQAKELGWEEDHQVHVIIKHMFSPRESWEDPNFFKDLKEDILAESTKLGPVDKVSIFEHNPEGVVAIKFKAGAAATKCIEVMNGRFFAGRQLEASFYDGITDYYVEEDEKEKAERLEKWEKWLEGEAENHENK